MENNSEASRRFGEPAQSAHQQHRYFLDKKSDFLFANYWNGDNVWEGLVTTLKEELKSLSSSPLSSCSGDHHHHHHLHHHHDHNHHLTQGGCDWAVHEAVECCADCLTLYGFTLTIYTPNLFTLFLVFPQCQSCQTCLNYVTNHKGPKNINPSQILFGS